MIDQVDTFGAIRIPICPLCTPPKVLMGCRYLHACIKHVLALPGEAPSVLTTFCMTVAVPPGVPPTQPC